MTWGNQPHLLWGETLAPVPREPLPQGTLNQFSSKLQEPKASLVGEKGEQGSAGRKLVYDRAFPFSFCGMWCSLSPYAIKIKRKRNRSEIEVTSM